MDDTKEKNLVKFISYIPHWCHKNWVSSCKVVVDFVVVVLLLGYLE